MIKKARQLPASKSLTHPVGPKLYSSIRPNAVSRARQGAAKGSLFEATKRPGPVKAFAFKPDATVAQKVYKFQHKTPRRFHTKGKTSAKSPMVEAIPLELTNRRI